MVWQKQNEAIREIEREKVNYNVKGWGGGTVKLLVTEISLQTARKRKR